MPPGQPWSVLVCCFLPAMSMPVVHEPAQACNWKAVTEQTRKVSADSYYAEYHGHRVTDIANVRHNLLQNGCKRFIYLLGDSSLDNKHWFFDPAKRKEEQLNDETFTAPCVNGFERALEPPRMVKDVAYWLNSALERKRGDNTMPGTDGTEQTCALMTSVEESTVADRAQRLLVQDAFVRDHIAKDDFLVVSMGGNDVALRPSTWTIVSMFLLTRSPDFLIRNHVAPGFAHMVDLFGSRVSEVVARVTEKNHPTRTLLCMIYYLDEHPGGSWADGVLSKLGYNTNPRKLQLIIRSIFEVLRERTHASGLNARGVHNFPLFAVLNPADSGDYKQRVEPSVEGGRKMAEAILQVLLAEDAEAAIDNVLQQAPKL